MWEEESLLFRLLPPSQDKNLTRQIKKISFVSHLTYPTNSALLINFRLSSDAEILLIKCRLSIRIGAKTSHCVHIPTVLPFCIPPLVVEYHNFNFFGGEDFFRLKGGIPWSILPSLSPSSFLPSFPIHQSRGKSRKFLWEKKIEEKTC